MAEIEKQSGNNNLRRGNPAWGKKSEGNGKSGNLKGKPRKEYSITSIQKEMLGQLCPYAKDPGWTWAYALAEAGMKDALTQDKARENLKDRFEGKILQPFGGEDGKPISVVGRVEIVSSSGGSEPFKEIVTAEST